MQQLGGISVSQASLGLRRPECCRLEALEVELFPSGGIPDCMLPASVELPTDFDSRKKPVPRIQPEWLV